MSSFPEKTDQLFVKLRTKKSATQLFSKQKGPSFHICKIFKPVS